MLCYREWGQPTWGPLFRWRFNQFLHIIGHTSFDVTCRRFRTLFLVVMYKSFSHEFDELWYQNYRYGIVRATRDAEILIDIACREVDCFEGLRMPNPLWRIGNERKSLNWLLKTDWFVRADKKSWQQIDPSSGRRYSISGIVLAQKNHLWIRLWVRLAYAAWVERLKFVTTVSFQKSILIHAF